MNKTIKFALLSVCLCLGFGLTCCTTVQREQPIRIQQRPFAYIKGLKVIPRLHEAFASTISVIDRDEKNSKERLLGSGVIIRRIPGMPIRIITNAHVIHSIKFPDAIRVKNTLGYVRKVIILKHDDGMDLALLEGTEIETELGPQATFFKEAPRLGEVVWAIGSPKGIEGNITRGTLSSITIIQKRKHYRTDAALFFGNSGGGLWNNKGELIAINRSIEVFQPGPFPPQIIPGGSISIPLETVKRFLMGV